MPGYVDHSHGQNAPDLFNNITKSPKAAKLNWSPNPPPSYDTTESSPPRGPARKEWDNVAARIAARTAANRSSRRSSRSGKLNRISKSATRQHKLGLSIDTTVTRHIAPKPQQIQLKSTRKRMSSGYNRLDDRATSRGQSSADRTSNPSQVSGLQHTLPAYDPSTFGVGMVSHFSPETPTIVITPALDAVNSTSRNRAASSLYSRATFAPSFVDRGDVPPMPSNPPHNFKQSQLEKTSTEKYSSRDSAATDFEVDEDEKANRHARAASNATLFEEDHTPLTAPVRGVKGGNLYIDTTIPPTPRRSRGWWNVITTPFESASRFLRSPTDGSRTPDVPPLPLEYAAYKGEKESALTPESARWPSLKRLKSQKQYQNEATVDAENPMQKRNPRATHNSQALRRLESHERLPSEPVPPLPTQQTRAARDSEYDTFSPNDREVPIVFSLNPTFIVNQAPDPFQSPNQDKTRAAGLGMTMSSKQKGLSPKPEKSPESGVTEIFSPIGQVAGMGTVTSSKAVIDDGSAAVPGAYPKGPHSHSNSRSSLAAEIVKHSSPALAHRPEEWRTPYYFPNQQTGQQKTPQPRQNLTFDAPPRSFVQPPARFSDYTVKTQKPQRKKLMFEVNCCGKREKKPKEPKKKKSRRRWCCCCLCFVLLLLVGGIIALAIILSRRGKGSSTQGGQQSSQPGQPGQPGQQGVQFVTVTNYPPIPTGALTIARPNLRTSVSGCVNPKTLWSCAVPKEQQNALKPNDPDQPNFAITINYDNSSVTSKKRVRRDPTSGSLLASSWIKRALLMERDTPASALFTPSPSPPTIEEQAFIGKTTDNNTTPFEGEITPFFISFNPPAPASKAKAKRQDSASSTLLTASSATTSVGSVPSIATAIPIPDVNPDGTAQPANLLPFPVYQPLRLYNRGRSDEHYGFYTYFERNIFLKSIMLQNSTQQLMGDIAADQDGGSTFDGANARCSWRDTRFKVQIFTNKGNTAQLLPSASGSAAAKSTSSAQDFSRPGTFPYPVTISMDRHGGGLTTKMLFCYGLDDRGHIDINSRKFQPEMRDFAGTLVNPALGPFTGVNVTAAQGGPGGIDGGTGGCECEWANWLSK